MKKLMILMAGLSLSACACFSSSEQEEVSAEPVAQSQQTYVEEEPVENVRVVRRRVRVIHEDDYEQPRSQKVRRIYYEDAEPARESRRTYRHSSPCAANDGESPCPSKVRVTREPVEVIYRKTKYTTVYQPKVYKDVSYSREPYSEYEEGEVETSGEYVEDDYVK